MSNYIQDNLQSDEEVLVCVQVSIWRLLPALLFSIVMMVIGIGIVAQDGNSVVSCILVFILFIVITISVMFVYLQIRTTYLVITNKRVLGKVGVLRIVTMDIHIDKVECVSYKAGIFGKIFHFYTLKIKGVGGSGWRYRGISNAREFKNMTNNAIECHAKEARREQAELIVLAMNINKS